MKNFTMKITFALLIAFAFYYAADYFAVQNWNNNESLIVRVIEAGPERVIPPENEHEESYEMLERQTVLQVLSGKNKSEVLNVKTVRLSGAGVEIIPGRRYLLVWDMFSDGRVQYSIADAFRVPSLAGIVMGICALFTALTGRRGFLALLGLGA